MAETYSLSVHPTLRRGARGAAVRKMQRRLVVHLTDLADGFADGDFGPATEQQVRRFQKQETLSQDGVVGRQTWSAVLAEPQVRIASPAGRTAATADRRQVADELAQRRVPAGAGSLADRVIRALRRKGYTYDDDGKPYHLTIVGIRSPSAAIDQFDDRIIIVYCDDAGRSQTLDYPITTDPGAHYTRSKLLNPSGAAILVPGQYRNVYKIGLHRNKYEALCQLGGKVTVWRDANRDDKLDRGGSVYKGWFGINIHRAASSGSTSRVGAYSAGCQVFKNADEFAVLMGLAKKSKAIRGNSFTYTLLEEADLS